MANQSRENNLIDYPCRWQYRIIGRQADEIKAAIEQIVGDREKFITVSNNSRSGNYISLILELAVEDEQTRNRLYDALNTHQATIMVI